MANPRTRRVLVVELDATGHRLNYVRILIEAILNRGHIAVLATTPAAQSSYEWGTHLSYLKGRFDVVECSNSEVVTIAGLAEELQADHVIIPDGDKTAIKIGINRGWPSPATLSLLIMRGEGQPSSIPGFAWLKGRLKRLLLISANSLPGVRVCVLKSSLWRGGSWLRIVRDPISLIVEPLEIERVVNTWGLDTRHYWFGVVGAVTDRKNLPLVVEALVRLGSPDVGLVIGGQITGSVRNSMVAISQMLSDARIPVVIKDKILSESELDSLIVALDCVVLAHSNDGPSGIFGKAAASGTRIVAAGAKSLREDCKSIPQNAVWTKLKVVQLSSALNWSRMQQRPQAVSKATEDEFVAALL